MSYSDFPDQVFRFLEMIHSTFNGIFEFLNFTLRTGLEFISTGNEFVDGIVENLFNFLDYVKIFGTPILDISVLSLILGGSMFGFLLFLLIRRLSW